MGLMDMLPCCGRRKKIKDIEGTPNETASLLPPQRAESIISTGDGYGAAEMNGAGQGGMTEEQRAKIEAIGRQVGNHMLPIHSLPPNHGANRTSPSLSLHKPNTAGTGNGTGSRSRATSTSTSTNSHSYSRPSSPSPSRPETSPPNGQLSPVPSTGRKAGQGDGEGEEGVVVKSVNLGAIGAGRGGRKPSGRGKGKKGKGKK